MMRLKHLFAGAVLICVSAAPTYSYAEETDWAAALAGQDVILFGEIHDNPEHHTRQAAAIAAVSPSAVVFEMLSAEQAEALRGGVPEGADEIAALIEWESSGWPDYAIYHSVFDAARGSAIYGAALPRDDVRAAVFGDAADIFGPDAPRYGLDQPLAAMEQTEREAMQMASHCDALPEDMLPGMVAAQRLRDAHFTRITLHALEDTGGPVVVITGNGHARKDWGMPAFLKVAAPEIAVITVGQFEDTPDPDAPFDLMFASPPAEREDPCAAFR